jgi:hypothetical protein
MAVKERLVVEKALNERVLKQLDNIGRVDIVVGIPSYRNARTIGLVAEECSEGLSLYYPDLRAVLANADGGSSDDSMAVVEATPVSSHVTTVSTLYNGLLGKGSGVRAIFEIAARLRARACVLVEAKTASITAEWVRNLAQPVLDGEYDLVMPLYRRHPRVGAPNDLLAYPMTWALYGLAVRQPAGGDFAISGELAEAFANRDVWETDVARFGIDVWLATLSVNEGYRICQSDLGVKVNGLKDPALPMDPRFLQMVGTLFRLVSIYRTVWTRVTSWDAVVPSHLPRASADLDPVPAPVDALWQAAQAGYQRFRRIWKNALAEADFEAVREMLGRSQDGAFFPNDLWARAVYDFTVVYNKGEGDPDKVAQALLPLFYVRTLSHLLETEGMTAQEREPLVREQARAFIRHRAYLWDRWVAYVPWLDEGTRI